MKSPAFLFQAVRAGSGFVINWLLDPVKGILTLRQSNPAGETYCLGYGPAASQLDQLLFKNIKPVKRYELI